MGLLDVLFLGNKKREKILTYTLDDLRHRQLGSIDSESGVQSLLQYLVDNEVRVIVSIPGASEHEGIIRYRKNLGGIYILEDRPGSSYSLPI